MFSNFLFSIGFFINFIRLLILELPDLIVCGILYIIGIVFKKEGLKHYARNNAKAIDLRGNAALSGDPQETISSRLGRAKGQERYFWVKLLRIFVDDFLFFFDYEIDPVTGEKIKHCTKSIDPKITIDEEIMNWNKNNG